MIAIGQRRALGHFTIIVAVAGERQTQNKTMKTNRVKIEELLNSIVVQPQNVPIAKASSESEQAQEEMTMKQMRRIFESYNDRLSDIFRALGIVLTRAHANWRPVDGFAGLQEKLAHIEIIPEVKANVSHESA
jgi:hypothetical protein